MRRTREQDRYIFTCGKITVEQGVGNVNGTRWEKGR